MSPSRNIILTGIPRSGTTLAAALLDALPDTVCLNEPGWQTAKSAEDAAGFARFVQHDFSRLREDLLAGNPVPDRRGEDGSAVTNYYLRGEKGSMENAFHIMPFTRAGLSADFTLAIKHNGPYLATLPDLLALKDFTIIALVRDPLSVLHSWRRLNLPISTGRLPNATPYWRDLAAIVESGAGLLEKQVRIYDLMCQRLWDYRSKITVLRYEALIKDPGLLAKAVAIPYTGTNTLISHAGRELPPEERHVLTGALAAYGRSYKLFYPEL